MQPVQQLFVYGSLRSDVGHTANNLLNDYFTLSAPAKVKGKLYHLGDYPGAVPVEEEAYIVGELYLLNEGHDVNNAFEALDDYEGVHPKAGETPLYRRQLTTVYTRHQTTTAWIYWYNQYVSGKPLIASGDVLQYMQQNK